MLGQPGAAVRDLVQPPLAVAQLQEAVRGREHEIDRLGGGHPHPGVLARQQECVGVLVDGVHPDIAAQAADIAAPVIEGEQHAARQLCQLRPCAQTLVERRNQRMHIGPTADPPRQRRGDDIANSLVGGAGQQPRRGEPLAQRRGIAHPPELHIAPRGEFDIAVAQFDGRRGQGLELLGESRPPGTRMRARGPSAASCRRSTPGQESGSVRVMTTPAYGAR